MPAGKLVTNVQMLSTEVFSVADRADKKEV